VAGHSSLLRFTHALPPPVVRTQKQSGLPRQCGPGSGPFSQVVRLPLHGFLLRASAGEEEKVASAVLKSAPPVSLMALLREMVPEASSLDRSSKEGDSASTNEDNPVTIDVLANDTDPDGDTLKVGSVTPPTNGSTGINGGGAEYTPAQDFNGTDSFNYTVSDGNGGTATATVTINVTSVNDAPSFTKGGNQTVNMNAGAQSVSWATNISKGADNENGQTLSFEVTNDNNNLFSTKPSIAPNGTLTYESAPDAFGSATVSVTLKDNGGSANGGQDTSATQTFTINVTAPTKVECKKGGWRAFGFPDQGTCITFVNENRP
jgi:hypothetical protein